MKLLQLNIMRGDLIYNLLDFLKREDADILNLQEVTRGMGRYSGFFKVYGMLQKDLGYKYSFYSPMGENRFAGRTVSEGPMILSKYKIIFRKTDYLGGKMKKDYLFGIRDKTRLLQQAKIDVDGQTINDLNYHGIFVWGDRMGDSTVRAYCKAILSYMKSLNQSEPIVLSGDFNLVPDSESFRLISRSYPDLVTRYRIKTTRNELSRVPEPVDNILVNKHVKVKSFSVPKAYVSDHLPLIMNFVPI